MNEIENNYGFWLKFPADVKIILINRGIFYRERKWSEIIKEMRERGAGADELERMKQGKKIAIHEMQLDAKFNQQRVWNAKYSKHYKKRVL